MPDLIRIAIIMALAFASTFVIAQATGILPEGDLVAWLEGLREVDPLWLVLAVIGK